MVNNGEFMLLRRIQVQMENSFVIFGVNANLRESRTPESPNEQKTP